MAILGIILLFVVLIIVMSIFSGIEQNAEYNRMLERREQNNNVFEQQKQKSNIPSDTLTVEYKSGYAQIASGKQFVWLKDNSLFFFPAESQTDGRNYILYSIALKDIEYYTTRGEVTKHTQISGGGGTTGGTSIKGAIIGGVIAGPAGAIIGSRKKAKIEPIQSKIITQDDRETFLNFFADGTKHSMFFSYGSYNSLYKLIPQKAFGNHTQTLPKTDNQSTILDQIKELAELKDRGILTEEEFSEKKKILLDKIN